MYTVKKKWIVGWICLPCFTVKTLDGDEYGGAEMTCSDFLCKIFDVIFGPFWTGKIHVTGEYTEE